MLAGVVSLASGLERELCYEKGPCCDLDWTGQGATIVKMEGEVLVSQSPTVPATVGMRVENGGRVMTLDNSTAVVAYDDGCWHILEANQVLTIEDVSPCCAVPIPPPVAAAPASAVPLWPLAGIPLVPLLFLDDDDNEPQPISR